MRVQFITTYQDGLFSRQTFIRDRVVFVNKGRFIQILHQYFLGRIGREAFFLFSISGGYATRSFIATILQIRLYGAMRFTINRPTFRLLTCFIRMNCFFVTRYRSFLFIMNFSVLSVGGQIQLFASHRSILIRAIVSALWRQIVLYFTKEG